MRPLSRIVPLGDTLVPLGAQWTWDVRVSAQSTELLEGRDYSYTADTGEIRLFDPGRVRSGETVLVSYSPSGGESTTAPFAFDPLILIPANSTGLVIARQTVWQFTPGVDYTVNHRDGWILRQMDGAIAADETVVITGKAFGFGNEIDGSSYTGLPATPDDFVDHVGLREATRLSLAGVQEGRDYGGELHYGRISAALENAASLLRGRAAPLLNWHSVLAGQPDSGKSIVLSVARWQIDPHQGEEVRRVGEQALTLMDSLVAAQVPPANTGEEVSSISYGAVSPLITSSSLRGW